MLANAYTQGVFVHVINNDKFKQYSMLRQKNIAAIDWLKFEADPSYEYVVFFDGFDTLFLKTRDEILQQFNDFYEPNRIISIPDYQYVCYPSDRDGPDIKMRLLEYCRKVNGDRYRAMFMNSGFFAGQRDHVIQIWEDTWRVWDSIAKGEYSYRGFPFDQVYSLTQRKPRWKDDDQLALNYYRFLHPDVYKVDWNKEFATVFGTHMNFDTDRRKLWQRRTPTDLNPIYGGGCIGNAAIMHMAGTGAGSRMGIAYKNGLVKIKPYI